MKIRRKAELIVPGLSGPEIQQIDLSGRTVEQVAADVDLNVMGIRTYAQVEGTVLVKGKSIPVASRKFDMSGTTFIDGQIMTLEELRQREQGERTLSIKAEINGWDRVVITRTGSIQPFKQGDRNLRLGDKAR